MDLKNQVGSTPTTMGKNTYDSSRRLTFLQGYQVCESHYSVGEGGRWGGKRGRVANNLISFPIQHAKTHTSATMTLSQQLLPEQKAVSSFNALKTKHIIFYTLSQMATTTSDKQQQLKIFKF